MGSLKFEPFEPIPLPEVNVNNAAHWAAIEQAMINVVHAPNGTARRTGLDAQYQFAGKTGTAQVFGIGQDEEYDKDTVPKHLQDHALFIAYAPAKAPVIAIAVIVENGGSGSSAAAPVARKILDAYLLEGNNIVSR